jgi:HEAT repeat protein
LYPRSTVAGALAAFGTAAHPAVPLLLSSSRLKADQDHDTGWKIQLAVAAKIIAPESTNALAPLIEDLGSSKPYIRQQTIYALGRLGTNAVEETPALLKCLSHPDSQTRIDATEALGNIGVASDEFIIRLGENLSHTNHFVADAALSVLGRFASASKLAFETIIKRAISSPIDRDVRRQAKYTLIDIARRDLKFLLESLDDSDVAVRSGALKVFYDLERGVPESIPKLQQLATNDPDASVRSLAVDVLRQQQ